MWQPSIGGCKTLVLQHIRIEEALLLVYRWISRILEDKKKRKKEKQIRQPLNLDFYWHI
jgi:hypothetical protein